MIEKMKDDAISMTDESVISVVTSKLLLSERTRSLHVGGIRNCTKVLLIIKAPASPLVSALPSALPYNRHQFMPKVSPEGDASRYSTA